MAAVRAWALQLAADDFDCEGLVHYTVEGNLFPDFSGTYPTGSWHNGTMEQAFINPDDGGLRR